LELYPHWTTSARDRCAAVGEEARGTATVHAADARLLSETVENESIDLVVTSPPYWDILRRKRTADRRQTRHYGDDARDLGREQPYQEFLDDLQLVYGQLFDAVRPGGYCCMVVKDMRKKNQFFPFHTDARAALQEVGFVLDGLIMWDLSSKYHNLKAVAYPWVLYVNTIHEFILIMRKRK
jgi:DNA modification methylase